MNAASSAPRSDLDCRGSPPVGDVVRVMSETYGRDISRYDESYLARTVEKRCEVTLAPTGGTYLERLATDTAEAEAFWGALHVTYSDFFRNPLAFALLEQLILPGLLSKAARRGHDELRIWSAGCAAGQEPWSLAILLAELAGMQDRTIPYRIFATDSSDAELERARSGVYSPAALGNVRWRYLHGPFARHGDNFAIAPQIRARVEFSLYDLLDEATTCPPTSIYGDFDLVLCSNVLLYYRPEAQHVILAKLRRCLAPGGYLLTGESERQIVENAGGFRVVAPPATVFQRKD